MQFMKGRGKEYSEVAIEIEDQFKLWLENSNLSLNKFEELFSKGDQNIIYKRENDFIEVAISVNSQRIGVPLLWNKESGILEDNFKTDILLFLLYIGSQKPYVQFLDRVKLFAMELHKKQ